MTPPRAKGAPVVDQDSPQGQTSLMARWIVEGLVAPLAEALAPKVAAILQRKPPVERVAFSADEVAEATSLSRAKVYELIGSGLLPSIKIDGRRIVRVHALEYLLERLERENADEIAATQPVQASFGRTA